QLALHQRTSGDGDAHVARVHRRRQRLGELHQRLDVAWPERDQHREALLVAAELTLEQQLEAGQRRERRIERLRRRAQRRERAGERLGREALLAETLLQPIGRGRAREVAPRVETRTLRRERRQQRRR